MTRAAAGAGAVDVAITREVARSITTACELTFIAREPIDYERAVAQHDAYCARLAAQGIEVIRVPADEALPDCCFVEDVAVVADEFALLTMPGAPARRGERSAMLEALERLRPGAGCVTRMELPATLDGGDVLRVGRTFFVGMTTRTNADGIACLRALASAHGYAVVGVRVPGCLHLKSAASALDEESVLVNRAWLDCAPLVERGLRLIDIASEASEAGAANVLRVRDELWVHPGYPRTRAIVEEHAVRTGARVVGVDISEFVKAEAALTCKSVLLRR